LYARGLNSVKYQLTNTKNKMVVKIKSGQIQVKYEHWHYGLDYMYSLNSYAMYQVGQELGTSTHSQKTTIIEKSQIPSQVNLSTDMKLI